jgi:hypothetical protein
MDAGTPVVTMPRRVSTDFTPQIGAARRLDRPDAILRVSPSRRGND